MLLSLYRTVNLHLTREVTQLRLVVLETKDLESL